MRLCGATWRHSLYCIEYATIPPCNTTPYFSTHLPRQFLGVRGLVYKGGAVSRSAVCLLGLGADCLCLSSGSSRFLRGLLCGFFRPNYLKRFERSSCGCVSAFGFSSKSVRNTFFWLDMVRLGSVAKLLQPKSFCKRLSSINLPKQLA